MRRLLLGLAGPIVFLVLILSATPARAMLLPGDTPPPLLGVDVNGQMRELAEFRGRVVIVSFWASWCAPCFDEMKLLERVQRSVGRDRLVVASINFAQSSEVFAELKTRLSDVDLMLTSDPHGALGTQYGVNRIPFSFVIDQQGVIRYVYSGYGENIQRALAEDLDRLLERSPR